MSERINAEKWRELSREAVLETPFFTLWRMEFQRADGSIIRDYYLIEKKEAVQIAAITHEEKVVLIKHYRPGPNEISVELPAGYVEKGKTLETACQEELLEETGYKADNFLEITNFTQDTSRYLGYPLHLFWAWNLIKVKSSESLREDKEQEEIKVLETNLEEALRMIDKKEIKDLPTIAGLLLIKRFLRKHKHLILSKGS